jgi:hypothetical protein
MRRAAATILLAITLLALVVMTQPMSTPVHADDPNQVGLVVRFSNGSTFTACIEFDESQLTGEEVLDRSGLSILKDTSYGLGAAICRIEGDGCDYPQENCFCQCEGVECEYWAYYHLDRQNNEWIYSGMGATWHTVQHGDVEGWAWGAGDPSGSDVEPPPIPFEQLCAQPTATPEPPVVSFTADPQSIVAGQCSELRWDVQNADFVVLDGAGVPLEYTREVCPTSTQTYELRVANAAGEFEYRATINVAQPTSTPTLAPTATRRPTDVPRPATGTPTPTMEATSADPSPPPSNTPVALLTFPATTSTAIPTHSPTVVAMVPRPIVAAVEEIAGPSEQVASAGPSPREGVTLDRILLLIGVSAGTLGFGGLAFIGIILLLIIVYLRARVLFIDHQDME